MNACAAVICAAHLIVGRTEGALSSNPIGYNQHDADYATFHRVRDFRRLALNLFPDAQSKQ